MTDLLDLDGKELERELDRIVKANPPKSKPWSEKEGIIVRRLYEAGVSTNVIATKLCRSTNAVEHFIQRENLRRPV